MTIKDQQLKLYGVIMKIKLLISAFVIILVSAFTFGQTKNYYLGTGTDADISNQGISCASCHTAKGIASPKYDTWKFTKHSFATDSGYAQSNHFGYRCLKCHTTGWDPTDTTGYFGADQYVVQDTSLHPDFKPTDTYNWNRTKNVGCEACHGPLGKYDPTATDTLTTDYDKHFAFSSTNKLNYQAELCGVCHTGKYHGDYDEWKLSGHALSLNASNGFVTKNARCAKCHVAQNAAAFLNGSFFTGADKGKPYTDKILIDSNNPDIAPITCVVCHDPHGNGNEHQVRVATSSSVTVCDKCHNPEITTDTVNYNSTPHNMPSAALSGSKVFGYRYTAAELRSIGMDTVYQNSAHTYAATERCINCHMNRNGKNELGNFSKGHTFAPRPEACLTCHADYLSAVDTTGWRTKEPMFDYRRVQTVTDSLITVLQNRLNKATTADSTTDAFKKANFNLRSVIEDKSQGIHNTRLTQKLLKASILFFTPTVGIKQESNSIPAQYSLSQNYPNPFNPSTQIKFTLPEAGNVKLTIYDAIGRQVTVLVNDYLTSGTYRYTWNASNLASGIYFYRIEAKNFNMVKKMVLIK